MNVDRIPIFQSCPQLIIYLLANIEGAVRVHDLSTWPENQKLFVFCTEPTIFAEKGGLCNVSSVGTVAYA